MRIAIYFLLVLSLSSCDNTQNKPINSSVDTDNSKVVSDSNTSPLTGKWKFYHTEDIKGATEDLTIEWGFSNDGTGTVKYSQSSVYAAMHVSGSVSVEFPVTWNVATDTLHITYGAGKLADVKGTGTLAIDIVKKQGDKLIQLISGSSLYSKYQMDNEDILYLMNNGVVTKFRNGKEPMKFVRQTD